MQDLFIFQEKNRIQKCVMFNIKFRAFVGNRPRVVFLLLLVKDNPKYHVVPIFDFGFFAFFVIGDGKT